MTIEIETVPLTWFRGFPPQSGMYLVELEDGEHIVTPYTGEGRWHDGEYDERTGWLCLTHSRATVQAWAHLPKRQVR